VNPKEPVCGYISFGLIYPEHKLTVFIKTFHSQFLAVGIASFDRHLIWIRVLLR